MSRPRLSVPNQCCESWSGRISRLPGSIEFGSWTASAGAKTAPTITASSTVAHSRIIALRRNFSNRIIDAAARSLALLGCCPQARIDHVVQNVDDRIQESIDGCDDDDTRLRDCIITRQDRVDDKPSQPGPRKDDFDDDSPTKQASCLKPEHSDYRYQYVLQCMAKKHPNIANTLGAGGCANCTSTTRLLFTSAMKTSPAPS